METPTDSWAQTFVAGTRTYNPRLDARPWTAQMLLVTGGAGFIGSNFVNDWLAAAGEPVAVVDKLTYAGNLSNLARVRRRSDFAFERADIGDEPAIRAIIKRYRPRAIIHFAAETHVDRSVYRPAEFVQTNVNGTLSLLEAVREYWSELTATEASSFRFLHVSTDEVYGSLAPADPAFTETTAYAPNSPYAASKAASDHLVRAFHQTYRLPTLTTHCCNNYGPYQFPEKLIPLMILNALDGKTLPVYGDGRHVRDWLYVGDHCAATRAVLARGKPGEVYNIGARCEMENIDVVRSVCRIIDDLRPKGTGTYEDQIAFVEDRPGHDRRYAIDPRKLERDIGWQPAETFSTGLRKTVEWYLQETEWIAGVGGGSYREWMSRHYGAQTVAA